MNRTKLEGAELGKPASQRTRDRVNASLRRRYRTERRFRMYGVVAVLVGAGFLLFLFTTIFTTGIKGFQKNYLQLQVSFDPEVLGIGAKRDPKTLSGADFPALVKAALRREFPQVSGRCDLSALYSLASAGTAFELQDRVFREPNLIGTTQTVWLPADAEVGAYVKGTINGDTANEGRLSEQKIGWIKALQEQGKIEKRFNETFFTAGDSREPELAGIWGAVKGSFYTMLVTLLLSFPLGVAAAVYLEEFAPKNVWTDLIEVNINNLAAVPSIIFGLLGLAIFINVFGLPRSAPLVGGLVLTLMTLPVIIIAGRAALKAVPPSIREAALGLGASRMQAVFHHVFPLALPGMLTGTIIGMGRALGETAPLLMIGMVAFIVNPPSGILDAATVLPVQIYLWADSPERGFVELTSTGIIVLLAFLLIMNGAAVWLRKRFERRW
jgi:phosphate transport system permease protein